MTGRYIIECPERGIAARFVAQPGLRNSYTTRHSSTVRTFPTFEEAQRNCCGNEIVVQQ